MGAGLGVILSGAAALTGIIAESANEILLLVNVGSVLISLVDEEAGAALVSYAEKAVWASEFLHPIIKELRLAQEDAPAPKRLRRE